MIIDPLGLPMTVRNTVTLPPLSKRSVVYLLEQGELTAAQWAELERKLSRMKPEQLRTVIDACERRLSLLTNSVEATRRS